MSQHPSVSQFVAGLDSCADVTSLKTIMSDFLSSTGFSKFAYNIFKNQALGLSNNDDCFVISNFPDCWQTHYMREGYNGIDPVLHQSSTLKNTICWNNLQGTIPLTRRQRQLFAEAHDVGLYNGLTFPIATEVGAPVAFSIVPDTPIETGQADVLANVPLIRLAAQTYHHRAKRILVNKTLKFGSSKRKALLSSRELDVLGWAARGKTGWEIATILAISSKSVEGYLETARNKLHAANRTHAVVKAIMLDMINVDS